MTFVKKSPSALVNKLRKRKGKDLWLIGDGELAREFLKAGLVDEQHMGVVPVLPGEGIPLFPGGFPQCNLALLQNRTFSKGFIELKYRVKDSKDRA